MRASGLLPALWWWLRSYLVAGALVVGLGVSCARTLLGEFEPRPQHPPPGYVLSRCSVQLQWSAGTRQGAIRLQVAQDDRFEDLVADEVVRRNTFDLDDLTPGGTYYWRLLQGERVGAAARFDVARTALRYR
jgi:hypothetical protein